MVGREEQPGRVRPTWWGLTRSRSVSVPRSRGDVISGGSRVVFFLPRSFSSSLAPIASSPSSFLLLTRFNDNTISLRAFPLSLPFPRDNYGVTEETSFTIFFLYSSLFAHVPLLVHFLHRVVTVSCSRGGSNQMLGWLQYIPYIDFFHCP